MAFMTMLLCGCSEDLSKVVRVGFFPNISHAHALIAKNKGWFEQRLGGDIQIRWQVFNAGPSAMESLLADAVDITYVGPNPAINAYARTNGEDIRILAGATDGGAALVVNANKGIKNPSDFRGLKIGTPQLGNTQDVACRAWLLKNGIKITQTGGDAHVIPTPNPQQLQLFQKGDLDAVWTVEPWITRLEQEAGAKVYLEQNDAITTVLVSNVKLLNERPEIVKKFIQAHKELIEWINKNPEEAQKIVQAELEAITKVKIPMDLIQKSWKRMKFTSDINPQNINEFIDNANKCGVLELNIGTSNLFYK